MGERVFYLTKEGLKKIREEKYLLEKYKTEKVRMELPSVLKHGEPESDQIIFYEELGLLEKRIVEINNVLENAVLIKTPSKNERDHVYLGAKVVVEGEEGISEFELVGTVENDPIVGKISDESPIGKALLGRRVSEEVFIPEPINKTFRILKVMYR
ncbi:MAG: GreA/GreB family elongation factor [Candidatus Pacebacteria bacterium]|nr:GreA/GreB family elongation factor [Candidatus Paceibacterota bacterium]